MLQLKDLKPRLWNYRYRMMKNRKLLKSSLLNIKHQNPLKTDQIIGTVVVIFIIFITLFFINNLFFWNTTTPIASIQDSEKEEERLDIIRRAYELIFGDDVWRK